MAHKYPHRRYDAVAGNPPVDVDDFNESLFAHGSEAGLLDETNFGTADAFGTTEADRLAYMQRDSGFKPYVETSALAATPQLDEHEGWVPLVTRTFTCGDATLRISGRFEADTVGAVDAFLGDIRVNGQRVFDGLAYTLGAHPSHNIHALVDVAAGTQTVELIADAILTTSVTSGVDNKLLCILVMEK